MTWIASTSAKARWRVFKDEITTPDILTAHFEFARCPVTWKHRIWGAEEYAPEVNNGIFFFGDKETVFVTDDQCIVIPRGKSKDRQAHQLKSDAGQLHMAEFLEAVRTRRQPGCTPEEAHLSTTTVKLAMIAYETQSTVNWHAPSEQVTGNPAAAQLLKRDYRKPWEHP